MEIKISVNFLSLYGIGAGKVKQNNTEDLGVITHSAKETRQPKGQEGGWGGEKAILSQVSLY